MFMSQKIKPFVFFNSYSFSNTVTATVLATTCQIEPIDVLSLKLINAAII